MAVRKLNLYPLLFLLIAALFLGTLTMIAIMYQQTGKPVINSSSPLLWSINAAWLLVLLALYRFFPPLLRCSVCGVPADDVLIYPARKRKRVCRKHLLEGFQTEFVFSNRNMVVFHPGLDGRSGPYVYQYMAMKDVSPALRNDDVGQTVTAALNSIAGNCTRCGGPARIAWFGPGTFRWETTRVGAVEYDLPRLDQVTSQPEIVCAGCIVAEIVDSLGKFEGDMVDGLILPYDGEGVLLPGIV